MGFGISSLGGLTDSIGGFLGSSTGSALVQSVANNYFNKKAASKQYQYTKSLIDYENEYNTPKNQMVRLEEAGLNPNLVYNNGSATIASASGSAPQVKPAQLDMLSAYNLEAQNKLLEAQMYLTKKNDQLTDSNIDKVEAQTTAQEIKNKKDSLDLKFYEDTGVDPDSALGNFVKPVWNNGKALGNSVKPGALSDRLWNKMMLEAKRRYLKRVGKI